MHTLIENILFIFLRALETGRKRVFDKLFCPVSQRVVMNYYVYCVYPAMLKSLKQLPNCLERAETSIALIIFYGCSRDSPKIITIFFANKDISCHIFAQVCFKMQQIKYSFFFQT